VVGDLSAPGPGVGLLTPGLVQNRLIITNRCGVTEFRVEMALSAENRDPRITWNDERNDRERDKGERITIRK
jgi:hypothetical protein